MSKRFLLHFQHLVVRGATEELLTHISRPEEFHEHRRETAAVVVDATAMWLKLRGEDQVYISEAERANTEARKRISKAFKRLQKDKAEEVEKFRAMRAEYEAEQSGDFYQMIDQIASSAGDKYRVTLINVSGVEHWFDPSQAPTPSKKKSILLVPCARHIKIRCISLHERTLLRDFSCDDYVLKDLSQLS